MRILTGLQPSGILHIGNYFGAMRSAIELQNQNPGNTFLFIADLHSLTVNPDPADLRMRIQRLALDFLACGLDPEKTAFFRPSETMASSSRTTGMVTMGNSAAPLRRKIC